MKKKYSKIIELAQEKEYLESANRSQLFLGWGCLFGSVFFLIAWIFWNHIKSNLFTSIGLFFFSILALYVGYNGKNEIEKLNNKLKRLTK